MAHLIGIKSYLAYYDIDIIPSKFKRKVKVPKEAKEDEEPIDVKDIRTILLACNNRRLKAYILVLASAGLRAIEGLSLRLRDCDLSVTPTKIHVRKEYSKTRVARMVYISDEATNYLKEWIAWKYRDKGDETWTKKRNPEDLVFSVYTTTNQANPEHLYIRIVQEFQKVLSISGLNERKEGMRRRKITLHTLRRFTKTVISNQAGQDFSEMILGHKKSVYYTLREQDRREIYRSKCMSYLTFLDYTTLEATGKSIEAKLSEKEKEIQSLRERDTTNSDAIAELSSKLLEVMKEVADLKKGSSL
jgi:integrase